MRKKISSDKMPWKKIVFDVSNCDGELLISLFSSMENVAIIEIGNQVEVIFPAGDWQKIFEILKLYHAEFDIPQLIVSESDVSEENWALKWQKYFKKIDLPNGICICPFWEEPTQDAELEIAIKPGMAFGTGTHETTQMALLLLKKYIRPGMKVLDAGYGNGILTIEPELFTRDVLNYGHTVKETMTKGEWIAIAVYR